MASERHRRQHAAAAVLARRGSLMARGPHRGTSTSPVRPVRSIATASATRRIRSPTARPAPSPSPRPTRMASLGAAPRRLLPRTRWRAEALRECTAARHACRKRAAKLARPSAPASRSLRKARERVWASWRQQVWAANAREVRAREARVRAEGTLTPLPTQRPIRAGTLARSRPRQAKLFGRSGAVRQLT